MGMIIDMRTFSVNERSFIALLAIVGFVLTFANQLPAQDKKLDAFTIYYASVSGTRGPFLIAKDLGLF